MEGEKKCEEEAAKNLQKDLKEQLLGVTHTHTKKRGHYYLV